MNLKQRIGATIATGAMVVSVFAPITHAADPAIVISDNGNHSNNNATVNNTSNTTVNQTNVFVVSNNVTANSNTGGNDINGNNGRGDKSITTGDATNNVTINNTGGNNTANVTSCPCPTGEQIRIRGNGNHSDNEAVVNNDHTATYLQGNVLVVGNTVNTRAKTGGNKINNNNGRGSRTITTRDALNTVRVTNTGGHNSLTSTP